MSIFRVSKCLSSLIIVLAVFIFAVSSVEAGTGGINMSAIIDNYKDARPPFGINEADAVYEFPVEGGITRMMVVYKGDTAASDSVAVGPIRSARPFFARVGSVHQAVFAHAGGSVEALLSLDRNEYNVSNMDALSLNAKNYFYREDTLNAPHNLFTTIGNLKAFRNQFSGDLGETPTWPWTFAGNPTTTDTFEQNEVLVDYDGEDYDIKWLYDPVSRVYKRYIKVNGAYEIAQNAKGQEIVTENLAVQYAHTNSLMEIVENEGRALVCRLGKCQNANWKKENIDKPIKFYSFGGEEIVFVDGRIWINTTQNTFFDDIELAPGWNVFSTPRVLDSHQFSFEATLDNLSIYTLNQDSVSGWSTMAEIGQTEFTPLYGYFLNNKTGTTQTLTMNYARELEPNKRLFVRDFNPGWNVFGVASPDMAHAQNKMNYIDTNNVRDIISSFEGKVSSVLDFNNQPANTSAVKLSDDWRMVSFDRANELDDLRQTKAYGAFMTDNASLQGSQNLNPVHHHKKLAINIVDLGDREVTDIGGSIKLAEIYVTARDYDMYIEEMPLSLMMGTANAYDNLRNIRLYEVGKATSAFSRYYDSNLSTTKHSLSFKNLFLQKNKVYHFVVLGDVVTFSGGEQTYQLKASSEKLPSARNWPSGVKVALRDMYINYSIENLLSQSFSNKIKVIAESNLPPTPTASLVVSKVTTNSVSAVKNSDDVLLYKGKLTASNVDDLRVSRLPIASEIGFDNNQNFNLDWDRLYLYKVNTDGTETLLDTESSLDSTTINFAGFTLNVPKGISNSVMFVIRGDVKSSPSGTTTKVKLAAAGSWTVKDSDNNTVTPTLATGADTVSHTTTVNTKGTYTMAFDNDAIGLNNDKNILAGGMALIGRLKLSASKEAAILEDLVIRNNGDATNRTVETLYLYDNREMSGTALGSADFSAGDNPKVLFENINIEIPTTGSTYLYVAVAVKGIDYSADPGAYATAVAGKTISLNIPIDEGVYETKAVGKATGEELDDAHSATIFTSTSTVMGAVISDLSTDFADKTLSNGIKDIFSFKVTVPDSNNIDYNSDPLAVQLGTVTFTIATSGVNVSGVRVERVGGENGEKIVTSAPTFNTVDVDFKTTYGTNPDLQIRPGETAEYVIRALITGSYGSGDSVDVSIEGAFDSNVIYNHTTSNASTFAPEVFPLITGTTYVRGGTLSN